MIIELKSKSSIAKIDTKGAELISLQDGFGVEFIWQKDPKFWNRSSPVLFPIVGNLRDDKVTIEGKIYTIPKHGFMRDQPFKIVYQSDTKAILNYSFTEETLAVYPYKFNLSMTYELNDVELLLTYTVMNLNNKPIDFCLGAHPAFNIPVNGSGEFEDYCLEFNKPEPAGCATFDFAKMEINVDDRKNYVTNSNKIMLKYEYFNNDALIFDKLNSDIVKLYSVKSGRGVEVKYFGFDFVAFWTPIKMNAPFLCIEPWCGMAVCSDEDNELTSKRGVKHLEVDEQFVCKLSIIPM